MNIKKTNSFFNRNKWLLLLTLVFIIYSFFRFINLDERIPFAWDQEQFSNQIRGIIKDHDFTLLGPRVTNDRGFFLAPYFTYLLVPFYYIFNLDPNALILFIVVLNISFFALSTWTIKEIFNIKNSLVFLLLWAINPLLVKYDSTPWWPILIPLGVILTIYLPYLLVKAPKKILLWSLLGVTLAFFLNMHFQFIFIALFVATFLIAHFRFKLTNHWLGLIISSMSFLIMFLPLVIFDIRNKNLNLNLLLAFFNEKVLNDQPYYQAWQPVFTNFIYPLTRWNNTMVVILFFVVFTALLIYLIKIKKNFVKTLYISTLVLLMITALGFSLYGLRPSEYYFVYLYPFIYIAAADFLLMHKKYFLIPIILIFLVVINLASLKNSLNIDPGGLQFKRKVAESIVPYTKGKKANVTFDMPIDTNTGYIYLLEVYGVHRSGDWNDPLIIIRSPSQKGDIVFRDIGVRIPPELK